MFEKIKDRLIDEARDWYKMWSSWLAVIWGLVVTIFWVDPTVLARLVATLPEETRALFSPLVLGAVAGLPIIINLIKQNSLRK